MSKPRPGVEAAKRLSKCKDEEIWRMVETKFSEVVSHLKGFDKIEREYSRLGMSLSKDESMESITKDDLLSIVRWKFAVGKPRHALMKHLTSNTEASVLEHSESSIAKARCSTTGDDMRSIKSAMEEFVNLKGVGPATASALLSLVQPEVFAYMYDEVIDCFLPKRTYTMSTYIALNENCIRIANSLGDEWTASRVATVLWTAARAKAYKLEDCTLRKRPLVEKNTTVDSKDRRVTKRRKS